MSYKHIRNYFKFNLGCPVGLLRSNSSAPCKYPYYGMQCSHQCNCSEEYCNHVIGCVHQQGIMYKPLHDNCSIAFSQDKLICFFGTLQCR